MLSTFGSGNFVFITILHEEISPFSALNVAVVTLGQDSKKNLSICHLKDMEYYSELDMFLSSQ